MAVEGNVLAWPVVFVLVVLVLAGFCAVLWLAWAGLRQAWAWLTDWLQSRIDPPWWWKPWLSRRVEEDDLEGLPPPLPPERTWEQMTSHQLPLAGPDGLTFRERQERWEARRQEERERRAPWWEAEHRAAYESLGFDYPSGLMARVRELTP